MYRGQRTSTMGDATQVDLPLALASHPRVCQVPRKYNSATQVPVPGI